MKTPPHPPHPEHARSFERPPDIVVTVLGRMWTYSCVQQRRDHVFARKSLNGGAFSRRFLHDDDVGLRRHRDRGDFGGGSLRGRKTAKDLKEEPCLTVSSPGT